MSSWMSLFYYYKNENTQWPSSITLTVQGQSDMRRWQKVGPNPSWAQG